jgi:hypothetical protein
MSYPTDKTLSHAEVWDNLPWFVNGRVDPNQAGPIENHLQSCAQCRDEFEIQRRIFAGVARDTNIACVPSVSFQRLWSRIERASGEEPASSMPPTAVVKRGRIPLVRWAIAALAVESLALAALVLALGINFHHGVPSGAYRTVSTVAPAPAAAQIRAVFDPAMTVQGLQAILQDAQLHIVSGPTEAGVYSLAPARLDAPLSNAMSLQRLRANSRVRFAESIGLP